MRVKASTLERATRLCSTSPTIQMLTSVERSEPALERVHVEQRLARVLVLAVAGVHHRRRAVARDERGRSRPGRADHDRRRVVGGERRDRVLERLALVDRGAGRLDAHDVRGEPLRRQLERRARARARLVEEVDDRAAAQRRHLLDVALDHLREALGDSQHALDVGSRVRSAIESRCFKPSPPPSSPSRPRRLRPAPRGGR